MEQAAERRDILVTSFGYRRGPAPEGPVIDARRVQFWDPTPFGRRRHDQATHVGARAGTGQDAKVITRTLGHPAALGLLDEATRVVRAEGRVAIGSTRGRHRSVVLAESLAWRIIQAVPEGDLRVRVVHRDLDPGPGPWVPVEWVWYEARSRLDLPLYVGLRVDVRHRGTGETRAHAVRLSSPLSLGAAHGDAQVLLWGWIADLNERASGDGHDDPS